MCVHARIAFDGREDAGNACTVLHMAAGALIDVDEATAFHGVVVRRGRLAASGLGRKITQGAIMGTDPKTSVVNRYLQSWEVHNLFVMGACVFPQNAGYNPTGTVGALTFWAADAIRNQYLKAPGPPVSA